MTAHLEVVAAGPLTTIQDLGRSGFARFGVPPSGAADRGALRWANRLVGNPDAAAALEVTLGGLRLRADGPVELALTGAPSPASVSGQDVAHHARFHLAAGEELRLRTPPSGLRTYVGVRGGIDVPPVLGSRATDLLSGLGPDVVRAGTLLPVGSAPRVTFPGPLPPAGWQPAEAAPLRVVLGPRADWFTVAAREVLLSAPWTVTPHSDRVGMRLQGPPLSSAVRDELPSEGVMRGALQVPPAGPPTLLLADHPLTGGYPVIAVVVDGDVDRAAQVRPGHVLRFSPAEPPWKS